MPRFIPRALFQSLAFVLLPGAILLAGYWFVADKGLFHWLADLIGRTSTGYGLSLLLTVIGNLLGLALLVLVLRLFTQDMMPLSTQLQGDINLLREPGTFQEKMNKAMAHEEERLRQDPQAAALQERITPIVLITLGFALGLVGVATLFILPDHMTGIQITLIFTAVGLILTGMWRFVFPKRLGK